MSFHETMDSFDNARHSSLMSSEFSIEGVAYQQAAIEEMERRAKILYNQRALPPPG